MGRNNKHKRGARNKRGPVRSERRPSLTGRVQLHEHSAYVVTENGDYKVMGRGKREIMDGDTVAVSIKSSPHGERRAVIEKPRHIAISFETAAPRSICHRVHIDTRFLRFFVAGRRNLQHYLFFQCSHEPHIMRGIFAAWSYRPSVTMGQCSLCLLSVIHQRGRIWYWQLLIECHVRFLES